MIKTVALSLFLFCTLVAYSQSPIGFWRTYDDETGKNKALVEIFEKNGQLFGKIDESYIHPNDTPCSICPGDRKDKLAKGLEVIRNMNEDEDSWSGGTILDPETGKVYKCTLTLSNDSTLVVRGYIGFSFIGRSQTWKRK